MNDKTYSRHIEKIIEHLHKAEQRHPEFTSEITDKTPNEIRDRLSVLRSLDRQTAADIVEEEMLEVEEAALAGDREALVDESYDAIAAILRLIDAVQEGRV